jgi:hypothetical protein
MILEMINKWRFYGYVWWLGVTYTDYGTEGYKLEYLDAVYCSFVPTTYTEKLQQVFNLIRTSK